MSTEDYDCHMVFGFRLSASVFGLHIGSCIELGGIWHVYYLSCIENMYREDMYRKDI